jgi:hypothetical protein
LFDAPSDSCKQKEEGDNIDFEKEGAEIDDAAKIKELGARI